MSWISIVLTFSLVENVVFARLLGLCPCSRATSDRRRLCGLGLAMSFLTTAGALSTWALRVLALEPLGLGALLAPVAALSVAVIASLGRLGVRLITAFAGRSSAVPIDELFGPLLRPVGGLCAALGVALVVARRGFGPWEALLAGLATGAGFFLALGILAGVAERAEGEDVPAFLRGPPVTLVSAGLAALALAALDQALIARLVGQ